MGFEPLEKVSWDGVRGIRELGKLNQMSGALLRNGQSSVRDLAHIGTRIPALKGRAIFEKSVVELFTNYLAIRLRTSVQIVANAGINAASAMSPVHTNPAPPAYPPSVYSVNGIP